MSELEAAPDAFMSHSDGRALEKEATRAPPSPAPRREDARALVRLIQCARCSKPFRNPVTLPCGNTLCKDCLPQTHERENISYPDLPDRRRAIVCPFADCGKEHPAAECSIDVTLAKVMHGIAEVAWRHSSLVGNVTTTVEEVPDWDDAMVTETEKVFSYQLPGARILATYNLAVQGRLRRNVDVHYHLASDGVEAAQALDQSLLTDVVVAAQKEVDCQVCYSVMLDPVTSFCGHTLCRRCMIRSLDHSSYCPTCRRCLSIPPSLGGCPSNKALVALLNCLCPEIIAARAETLAAEERMSDDYTNVPLFVCTLGFPNQPTFLRIFEPRYRLMLRRCLDGNRQFGMLMYNRYSEPQGDLGNVHFYHYGTMLRILQYQNLPNGSSLIETRGTFRFRVKSHNVVDGYAVGDVERIDDVPLTEEERIEAEETSVPASETDDTEAQVNRMSTQALLDLGRDFIQRMQSTSANWLQQRVLDVHGQVPVDAADFPYWFASVLPISEDEKYKLMETRTVRERLKITAMWIRRIESQRW